MSDAGQPPGGGEPVGSVGEEAAKLFGALSGWARDQAGDPTGQHAGQRAGEWGEALAHGLHEAGEHVATGSADCRWCPVCQVIRVVRQTSPEVRAHLTSAAGSLMQAAAALMAPPQGGSPARGPVERIDLDDPDDPDGTDGTDGTDGFDDHLHHEHPHDDPEGGTR